MTRPTPFSRREQEMMDVIYRLGRATAAEVREGMAAPPSYSSVRGTLGTLEKKGHLRHEYDGNRYIYLPTVRRDKVRQSALDHLVTTFFEGSAAAVVSNLLENRGPGLSHQELDQLSDLIELARKEGR